MTVLSIPSYAHKYIFKLSFANLPSAHIFHFHSLLVVLYLLFFKETFVFMELLGNRHHRHYRYMGNIYVAFIQKYVCLGN